MSMNETPSSERIHIGIFGRRNAGKSSLINALTGQDLSIVDNEAGTTTDPVYKAMELLPLGPVVLIDTPGIDDEGKLGQKRVKKSYEALNRTDIAVAVVDRDEKDARNEELQELLGKIRELDIPCVIVHNKCDDAEEVSWEDVKDSPPREIYVSAKNKININLLKEIIGSFNKRMEKSQKLLGDLLRPHDLVVLVVPIDSAAPKGRIILPQQMAIRDILDAGARAFVVKEDELKATLEEMPYPPRMVVTDSQVFGSVKEIVPKDIPLTSFSILMARYKGFLVPSVEGSKALDSLEDGDKVLISEGCTHHRQCEDIGTVKLPKWIGEYTGKKLHFEFTSGRGFPEDLSPYSFVLHCGGCMLNDREMMARIRMAKDQKISMSNYGITIAKMKGILERSVEPVLHSPSKDKDASPVDIKKPDKGKPIILASSSPRRRELLERAGINFSVEASDVCESADEKDPEKMVKILSERKALCVLSKHKDSIVIGADTVVALEGKVLGKPEDEREAFDMLSFLSGRTHQVYTGVCIAKTDDEGNILKTVFSERTDVCMYDNSKEMILEYIASGEPMDKAGAYGIQGKGSILVKKITGNYDNVVGLPVAETIRRMP